MHILAGLAFLVTILFGVAYWATPERGRTEIVCWSTAAGQLFESQGWRKATEFDRQREYMEGDSFMEADTLLCRTYTTTGNETSVSEPFPVKEHWILQ